MRASRTFRVIFGIFVLILFGAYSYMRYTTSPHSSDFGKELCRTYSEWLAMQEEGDADSQQYPQEQAEISVEQAALPQEVPAEPVAPAEVPVEAPVAEEPAAPAEE